LQLGYIKARIYTSDAQIPVKNATLSVYQKDGADEILIGVRMSDEQGNTSVIPIEAPDSYLSQNEGNYEPFVLVNLRIDHPEFKTIYVNGAQVFAGQISIQEVAMQPIDRNVPMDSRAERFDVTNQNL